MQKMASKAYLGGSHPSFFNNNERWLLNDHRQFYSQSARNRIGYVAVGYWPSVLRNNRKKRMYTYILHHTYGPLENESYKLLGVFSSQLTAEQAKDQYLTLPGFRDYPEGFSIIAYSLDESHWTEGFEAGEDHIFD